MSCRECQTSRFDVGGAGFVTWSLVSLFVWFDSSQGGAWRCGSAGLELAGVESAARVDVGEIECVWGFYCVEGEN